MREFGKAFVEEVNDRATITMKVVKQTPVPGVLITGQTSINPELVVNSDISVAFGQGESAMVGFDIILYGDSEAISQAAASVGGLHGLTGYVGGLTAYVDDRGVTIAVVATVGIGQGIHGVAKPGIPPLTIVKGQLDLVTGESSSLNLLGKGEE